VCGRPAAPRRTRREEVHADLRDDRAHLVSSGSPLACPVLVTSPGQQAFSTPQAAAPPLLEPKTPLKDITNVWTPAAVDPADRLASKKDGAVVIAGNQICLVLLSTVCGSMPGPV
jgi:hypothetical protein